MANMAPSRIGQINQAGDPLALFLKKFSGEVLTAFAETNVALARSIVRSIENGKSAQFPASWKGTASYHTPGTQLVGTAIGHNERIISIDDMLVADRSLAEIDDAMNHYDVRSIYSRDAGAALARAMDKNILQVGVLAARASATVSGGNGGSVITSATSGTSGSAMVTALLDAAQALDEKDVPAEDRYAFLKPAQYYNVLENAGTALSTDYNPGGNGSFAAGKIYRIGGLELVKTNNLPSTNVATGPSAYQGNFTTVTALVMHKSAVGTVKLIDVSSSADWLPEYLTWLLVAKVACGHGILRPESSVEIKSA